MEHYHAITLNAQDKAVTPFIQKKMYTQMPYKEVYHMQTSHSPFFSKPK